ncbi:MAG: hypothetical protein KF709_11900 [Gemmatimonadaceae bacterium]|nr:hypothetical protein [Gemmatimonadaceae bacterium]
MMMTRALLIAVVSTVLASEALAQWRIDLTGEPALSLSEPFTQIAGIRALPGNRAIVVDQMERRVLLVDLSNNTYRQIGREGGGPAEYRFPTRPMAAPDGRTLIYDAVLRRLLRLEPDGRFEPSAPLPSVTVPGGVGRAVGSDSEGRVYFEGSSFNAETGRFADSVAVVRWDPASDRVDLLGRVWSGGRVRVQRNGEVASLARSITPFPAVDAWVVLADARVAIVQQQPHRIVLRDAVGSRTVESADLSFPPVAITPAERNAYRAREEGARMAAAGVAGGGPSMRRPPTGDAEFPEAMPAFVAASLLASPAGELWIGRSYAHNSATRRYDVFSTDGRLVAVATLGRDRTVVGFGDGVIYVARTDPGDHLVYLELYRQ